MKRFNRFLRPASLANAVLLVAGLVCYHGGVFTKLMTSRHPVDEPESSATDEERPPEPTAAAPAVLSSSKWGKLGPSYTAPPAEQPSPTIMGGSKSVSLGSFQFTVDLSDWYSAPTSPPPAPSKPTDPK
jgi:hypothetical protein